MSTTTTLDPAARQAMAMDGVPDPQVPERARRRTYTAKYKRDVLAEYEACDRAGKGALLRREGLYTSLISALRPPGYGPTPPSTSSPRPAPGDAGGPGSRAPSSPAWPASPPP